jgi:predicted permease
MQSYERKWVQVMARIKPGVNKSKLEDSLSAIFTQVEHEASSAKVRMLLTDGSRGLSGLLVPSKTKMVKPLFILMALVGIVLLAACANLASLLLARGASRRQEMGVRAALGAGSWRLVRHGLTESMLIALVGAVGGLLLAMWGKQVLLNVLWPSSGIVDLSLNVTVLCFTLLICIGSALLFGLVPALRWSRIDPLVSMNERSSCTWSRLHLGKWMVSVQTAMALLLLVGAGLFVRTLVNLYRVDTGFRSENLLVFRLDGHKADMKDQQLADFYEQVRLSIEALPGVHRAAHSNILMLSGWMNNSMAQIPGRPAEDKMPILGLSVSDSFLSTMDISLLLGRDFSATDNEAGPLVILVNETLARTAFPEQNPIGQTLTIGRIGREYNIVGVFEDISYISLRRDPEPTVFYPYRQQPGYPGKIFYEVRTASNPMATVPVIRQIISDINPNVPMADIKTQAIQLNESISKERCFAVLTMSLALLAVLLSCIGLFGLMAYYTAQQTGEIGIRKALGATPQNIAWPILRSALIMAATGIALGVPAVFATIRVVRSFLFGIEPYDPVTVVIAVLLLFSVAILASWIPARRAAKIDPMEALRYE